jgi:hypothetical protein
LLMSVIITFMFEPAKLQMNWARASGTSMRRRSGDICTILRRLDSRDIIPVG